MYNSAFIPSNSSPQYTPLPSNTDHDNGVYWWWLSRVRGVELFQIIEGMFSKVTTILHLRLIRGCMSSININVKGKAFAWCPARLPILYHTMNCWNSLQIRFCVGSEGVSLNAAIPALYFSNSRYFLETAAFPRIPYDFLVLSRNRNSCPILLFLPNMKRSKNYIATPPNSKSVESTYAPLATRY